MTNSRIIAPWSKDSCAQWIGRLRLPCKPASVSGLRPALKRIGTFERAALMMPLTALPAPTITWTMTTCGRPVTIAYPWAIPTAGVSCGIVMGRGTGWPCASRLA